MQTEKYNLEFKQTLTDTFLKTVSAFANYTTGDIVFGMTDEGKAVGVEDADGQRLKIENKINDLIKPVPNYAITVGDNQTIVLTIHEGPEKPYLYRGKAYRRADTSTVEVDRVELNRLILAGKNQSFEELPAAAQEHSFQVLEAELARAKDLQNITLDTYKTLELYGTNGYNNAAYLLADVNGFVGIDCAKFGDTINEIRERADYSGVSIITQFHEVVKMFHRTYRFEKIDGIDRKTVDSIPTDAFREAVANALVHRTWDIPAPVRISMHPDHVEVVSPGRLPSGISLDEYASGRFSLLRNPILATVFFHLGYIEKFGTGITRIKQAYQNSVTQPAFSVTENSVTVQLPIPVRLEGMEESARKILSALADGVPRSRAEIAEKTGIGKTMLLRSLAHLVELGAVVKSGNARSTVYRSVVLIAG